MEAERRWRYQWFEYPILIWQRLKLGISTSDIVAKKMTVNFNVFLYGHETHNYEKSGYKTIVTSGE